MLRIVAAHGGDPESVLVDPEAGGRDECAAVGALDRPDALFVGRAPHARPLDLGRLLQLDLAEAKRPLEIAHDPKGQVDIRLGVGLEAADE